MNYKLIENEDMVKRFIEFLPDLGDNEKYYVSLFARKKYSPIIKSDKAQLKRFVSNKENLFIKLKQLECEIGSYTLDGISIPQEALCVYITVNPRDCHKASLKLLAEIANRVANNNPLDNPNSLALNIIQVTTTNKPLFDVDIDLKDPSQVQPTIEMVNNCFRIGSEKIVTFIRTRGGIHALIRTDLISYIDSKHWYNKIKQIPGVDMSGDNLVPFVGTYQGGFTPHFI